MKLAGKILMFIAVAILLLHAFLPHSHHEELSEEELTEAEHVEAHEGAATILDFIRLAFHLNSGSNYLEDYKNTQQYQAQFFVESSEVAIEFEVVVLEESPKSKTTYLSNFQTRFRHKGLSFRGPPA